MFGFRVPAPDEAMLISGANAGQNGTPFKVVTGHGAFVMPFVRQASFLTLAMQEAEVAEQCVTKQGIALQVKAVIAFKVGNDPESIVNAAQRFLSDQDQMSVLAGRIFAGHLRSIVGSMTVEEIVTERQKLATEVLDGSKAEMVEDGADRRLACRSSRSTTWARATSMRWPRRTTPPSSARRRSPRRRPTRRRPRPSRSRRASRPSTSVRPSIVQAQYKAEVDKAQAEAAQAGPLAQASSPA